MPLQSQTGAEGPKISGGSFIFQSSLEGPMLLKACISKKRTQAFSSKKLRWAIRSFCIFLGPSYIWATAGWCSLLCVCGGALPSVKLPWNVSMVSSCASDKPSDRQIIASHATAISTIDPCPSFCHTEEHLFLYESSKSTHSSLHWKPCMSECCSPLVLLIQLTWHPRKLKAL